MPENNGKRKRFHALLLLISFTSAFLIFNIFSGSVPEPKSVPLAELTSELANPKDDREIKNIVIDDAVRKVTIQYEDSDHAPKYSSYPSDYADNIMEAAEKGGVEAKISNSYGGGGILDTIISMVPLILFLLIFAWFISQSMGGIGKTKQVAQVPNVRFKDVAGVEEALGDMMEIVDFLKDADRFRMVGAKAPRGALLSGPPGVGKTLMAKAVAGEAGVPFFAATGSDFVEMFVGMGARRVRNLFKAARKHEKAVIFIDEIDSVGGKRKRGEGADAGEHNRTINAFLAEMDGFEESNIIVLAATNSPESLDPALVRSGRFDRKIEVDMPQEKGRRDILMIHFRGKSIDPNLDLDILAKTTDGLSGADLAALTNEALISAVRAGRVFATLEDFMDALGTITIGRARHSVTMTDSDRLTVAVHEAGHATVGLALELMGDPTHVTIVPRGRSGGHTKLQEPANKFRTTAALKAQMAMTMGGLAAERRKFGDITQGPGHDLETATHLAMSMVGKMGMGSSYLTVDDQTLTVNSAVAEQVRIQAETLVEEAVATATEVINDPLWSKVFEAMVTKLLEVHSIETDDIQHLKSLATGVEYTGPALTPAMLAAEASRLAGEMEAASEEVSKEVEGQEAPAAPAEQE